MFVQCLLTAGFQCSIMAVCMAKSSRGLRQGDPLAPSLFIIAEEVFSRGLLALYAAGAVKLHVPRGGPATSSHILFADDTIIFTNGSKRSLKRLMESTSGQLINKALAAVFVQTSRAQIVAGTLGFARKDLPIQYQGAPLFSGSIKKAYFPF